MPSKEHKFDKSFIRKVSLEKGTPIVDLILNTLNQISHKYHETITLLAVCPNSISVVRSALRSAKRFNAPLMFAATLNQVDLDGGYTTWTQRVFIDIVKEEAEKVGFKGPIVVALDHGGPWLKDRHVLENWGLDEAMDGVKKSLVASLEAGYDLLHIDATVDRALPKGESVRIERVVERTLELIEHVEAARRERNLPRISYEVGTEEVRGGLADLDNFRTFLKLLKGGLSKRGMGDIWPCFVVGKVGTDLHTSEFNPKMAKTLADIVQNYGSYVKGHYTDFVSKPQEYPKAGMGGANVGPEFSQMEFELLEQLTKIEDELAKDKKIELSHLRYKLKRCVIESNRWKKWLLKSEIGKAFSGLNDNRQKWLLQTCSRYIWTQEAVVEARLKLYQNLKKNDIDAEEMVLQGIDKAMEKYFISFNLKDASLKIERMLKGVSER